jgi:hypothetical protein
VRVASIVILVCASAYAQRLLPPDQGARFFEADDKLNRLKCRAEPIRPMLDFSLRFRAGYTVRVPLSQYRGEGHGWPMAVRVRPEGGGEPVYFLDRLSLPEAPDRDGQPNEVHIPEVLAEAGGGYLLGAGRYRASFLLLDDQNRTCRAEWDVDAQPHTGRRDAKMAIQPGSVQEISLGGTPSSNLSSERAVDKLTVLLHAAPVSPRMSKVQASDAVVLLGALSSLLELVLNCVN